MSAATLPAPRALPPALAAAVAAYYARGGVVRRLPAAPPPPARVAGWLWVAPPVTRLGATGAAAVRV